MSKKKEKFFIREFLNTEKSRGISIIKCGNSSLTITDCTNRICLDFYIDEYENVHQNVDNVEYKIDTLFNSIKKFRNHVKKKIRKRRKELNES